MGQKQTELEMQHLPLWVKAVVSLGLPTALLIWVGVEIRSAASWVGVEILTPIAKSHVATLEQLTLAYKSLSSSQEGLLESHKRIEVTLDELVKAQKEAQRILYERQDQ